MRFTSFIILICMFCITSQSTYAANAAEKSSSETYIVHVEGPDAHLTTQSEIDLERWYRSFLPTTAAGSNDGDSRIIYSYRTVFKGFAARLSPEEVKQMEKKAGFITARPEKVLSLHTTHTPNFLGLNQNTGLWRDSNYGKGVIIGVLDTGILPEHPSFSDEGMPPPPAKWKGKCQFNHTTCNNKIIGARYFGDDGDQSPLDEDGHGTHTASTAAGTFVKGANVFGNANGTAAGIAPLAHLAIYKVCNPFCSQSTILAAMDAAIEDGVDILSISIGILNNNFYQDFVALGAFSAMEKGILVSCSAGNSGPMNFTIANEAPWILTVGASTIDRKLRATAVLGNNQRFHGEAVFQPKDFPSKLSPLIYAGMINTSDPFAPFCFPESLNQTDLRGKIVLCESGGLPRTEKGEAVKSAGGAAMILMNIQSYANMTFADAHVLPTAHVGYADGLKMMSYINSTSNPTAKILFEGTVIGDDHAPAVAAFSSRGPNFASRSILKPDILGPGVNILAAWPTSVENNTNTKSTFNIISGTSMSCPHLSGVAALLKSVHPDWSPAAIKSAIMTTADVVNLAKNPIEDENFLPAGIFATGAGHVNPSKASDPGLVYDIQPEEYIQYLCGLNYTNREVSFFLQQKVNCSIETSIREAQLNYPSFVLSFVVNSNPQTYTRTVTNVGDLNEFYNVEIVPPPGIDVRVEPKTLKFSEMNQKLQYQVTLGRVRSAGDDPVVQGFLKWSSNKHSVRSPIAVIVQ